MEQDLKELSILQDRIIGKPFPAGVGLVWKFCQNSGLCLDGKYFSAGNISCKERISLKNHLTNCKLTLDSNKIYKGSIELFTHTPSLIIPKLKIVSDYSTNTIKNQIAISYQEYSNKVVLGIMNNILSLYGRKETHKFGFCGELSGIPNKPGVDIKVALWKISDNYRIQIGKALHGNFWGSFWCTRSPSNELAGKIEMSRKNVQIILGSIYKIRDNQSLRVRLDSEGKIGIELEQRLASWIQLSASADISVKDLAKEENAFLGFGISFNITNN